jgi:hypothetical protein
MKTSVPTYDEIVQRHGLSKILIGGDFQLTASGGLAMTPDGNPKIGDDKCNALRRLVQRWRFNARVLETLFTLVVEEGQRGRRAEAEREAVAEIVFSSGETTEKFHTLGEEVGGREFGAAACAGAIMVMLSNLLLRYKNDLKATSPKWKRIGPLVGGCSFGDIVVAGANNFRHHDEWARTNTPTGQQQPSIDILEAALNYTVTSPLIDPPSRRNACADLLSAVSQDDFEKLEGNFFRFAKAMM